MFLLVSMKIPTVLSFQGPKTPLGELLSRTPPPEGFVDPPPLRNTKQFQVGFTINEHHVDEWVVGAINEHHVDEWVVGAINEHHVDEWVVGAINEHHVDEWVVGAINEHHVDEWVVGAINEHHVDEWVVGANLVMGSFKQLQVGFSIIEHHVHERSYRLLEGTGGGVWVSQSVLTFGHPPTYP